MDAVGETRSISRPLGLVLAFVGLAALLVASVAVGSKNLSLSAVIEALGNNTGKGNAYVIWSMRVPRTMLCAVIGVALGVSGALIQALTRNPLADPGILGVNAGAEFFVVLGVALAGVETIAGYQLFAFAGALLVTVIVYIIGSAGRGGADPAQLTLAGVAVGAVLSGVSIAMVLADPRKFEQLREWAVGSVSSRGWSELLPVLPFLGVGLLLAAIAAPALNAIALGDDLARSLGSNIIRTRVIVIIAVTLLAGGATAIAGPIGFVGLMVPHVARWMIGPDQRWILAYTVVLAAALVVAADIVGRIVVRPAEFPVGVVTAFVGAPVLIALIRRRRVSAL